MNFMLFTTPIAGGAITGGICLKIRPDTTPPTTPDTLAMANLPIPLKNFRRVTDSWRTSGSNRYLQTGHHAIPPLWACSMFRSFSHRGHFCRPMS